MRALNCLHYFAFAGAALLFIAGNSPAGAQESAELDRLKATMAEMEKTIQGLKKQVAAMEKRQNTSAQPSAAKAVVHTSSPVTETTLERNAHPAAANLADRETSLRHRDTLRGENEGAPRPGNAPIDPSYKGFFAIPGTGTWVKLGGYLKVDSIVDSTRIGNPNKFITSTIPVAGQSDFGKDEQFTIHAKQTRINLELRSPTRLGSLKIFYENDFFGSSSSAAMDYNLRHFYGQLANLTVGHTWTTFFDPDASPDTLDGAGPGVESVLRQPQMRYTFSALEGHAHLAFAVEQPNADLGNLSSTATTRNIMPDFTAHWRLESKRGHFQFGGLARQLAYEDSTGPSDRAFGWGVNLSGVLHTWGKDSLVGNVTYGEGSAVTCRIFPVAMPRSWTATATSKRSLRGA